MNKQISMVASLILVAACGVDETVVDGPADGEHERFVGNGDNGGKTDTGGIAEGTDDALGVLHVVNTLPEAQLRSAVGLATSAAANISAYRGGDDEAAGTADDQQYETLAELDSIPFVGPVAFGKLLAYAEAEGFTDDPPVLSGTDDPFDPNACSGAPLSQAAAHARWASNQSILGSYQLAIRKRSCSTSGGTTTCGAWSPVSLSALSWRTKADGQLKLAKYSDSIKLQMVHGLCGQYGAYISPIPQYIEGSLCSGVGHTAYCSTYGYPKQCQSQFSDFDAYELPNGYGFALEGKVTENCAQLRDTTGVGNEHEVAILVRY